MNKLNLDMFYNPKSIAIYGASNNPQRFGSLILANILSGGFKGKVYPIHPKEKIIFGIQGYLSIGDVPETVDLVLMVLPTKLVLEKLEECGKAGVKGIIIVTAGFKEVGNERPEEEMRKLSKKYEIKIIGPNCIGEVATNSHVNMTPMMVNPIPGNVSLISQSGSYAAHVLLPIIQKIGLGISKIISVGNEACMDMVDFLEYLGEDDETKAIGLYIEGIKRGKKFIEVARKVSLKKPIVAIKIGQTKAGVRSAMSHTGSIANNEDVIEAVFKQTGIIHVDTSIQMLNALKCFSDLSLPPGKNFVIQTVGGGPGTKLADLLEANGVNIPLLSEPLQKELSYLLPPTASSKNPVDLTFDPIWDNFYFKIPKLLLSSSECDGLIIYGFWGTQMIDNFFERLPMNDQVETSKAQMLDFYLNMVNSYIKKMLRLSKKYNKPIIGSSVFFRDEEPFIKYCQDSGLPIFLLEEAADAVISLVKYSEWKRKQNNLK
ncbi:MAG: acetyl-CoA synthetase [Candidatus Lokiarchaeota archaeon]|nr:acetyl-CoA synthetase [Candidatus Lokiarchaeota archaeon]